MNTIPKIIFTLLLLAAATPGRAADYQLFARTNLVAWCIVPFDAKQRGPEARAQMLEKLGVKKLAYDWRAKDITAFDAEVAAMNQHGVEMTAWWFPGGINADACAILDCIKRNDIHPQLWTMLEGGPHLRLNQAFESTPAAQSAHVARLVAQVKPIAAEAAKVGCQVALYNHGGWAGVPENQIEIIKQLKRDGVDNVGIIYTQHHGYGEIDRFAELFPKIQPYLLAISLHGLTKDGDLQANSLREAPLGQGEEDIRLLRIIKNSGWTGPVGLIGEMASADVELRLQDQLAGLDWLVPQLEGQAPGPLPVTRAWKKPAPPRSATGEASVSAAFGKALRSGMQVVGKAGFRQRPLTVECWAKLDSADSYNILVASDTKASAEHWELYTMAGSGMFCLFQPGRGVFFNSEANICDRKWHCLAAVIEPERVRLFVDGKLVKESPASPLTGTPLPGDLAFGQLVDAEGGLGCDGVVDNVRLSRGAREISGSPVVPLTNDATTIGLWDFEETAYTPAHVNPAIVPVPRADWATSRQSLVLQRAKDNPGECDIVFIGDSITHGWEGAGKVWQKYYGNRKCLNFGVAGDLTEHVLWRFENGQLEGVKPRVVVLLIGTNNTDRDPEADILQGVQAVVKQIRARLAETKIILVGTFPRGKTFSAQRGKILQVNQALARLADGQNIFYLDFGSQLIEDDGSIFKSIMPDYLHLSERGYEIWAGAMEPKLKEWL